MWPKRECAWGLNAGENRTFNGDTQDSEYRRVETEWDILRTPPAVDAIPHFQEYLTLYDFPSVIASVIVPTRQFFQAWRHVKFTCTLSNRCS